MTEIQQIREQLSSKQDLAWFDSICQILRKENNPTTLQLTDIIGTERPNPKNEIRGSKFLDTYDKRFKGACINPNLKSGDPDQMIDYLGFWGNTFKITIGEISDRFGDYKTQINTYDGGTQIFFHPIPTDFEFTAIDCWTDMGEDEIDNLPELQVTGVTFRFGDKLVKGRDGYGMKRK